MDDLNRTPVATERRPGHRVGARRLAGAAAVLALGGAGFAIGASSQGGSPKVEVTAKVPAHAATGQATSAATPATKESANSRIARTVDRGLVDINTNLSYEDEQAAGTGMVLTSNGEVLTNNHVIEGATSISVTDIATGATYNATVVGYDRTHDVAVLQLTGASGLGTVRIANSSKVKKGDAVLAIGNAGGVGGTPSVAAGKITARNQSIDASDGNNGTENLAGLLETNAAIQPGDSGGPLVNSNGRVIGMDTAGAEASVNPFSGATTATQGFAIPINEASSIAKEIEDGTSTATIHLGATPFLGVQVESVTAGSSTGVGFFGPVASATGAEVVGLVQGSAAGAAGLATGDIITSLNGVAVTSASSLTTALESTNAGAAVPVAYVTSTGQQVTASVTLASGPPL